MKHKKYYRLLSIISVLALLLTSLRITGIVSTAQVSDSGLGLQSLVDAAELNLTNSTTKADFEAALKSLQLPSGYSVNSVEEFYVQRAIEGAIEKGSTYEGAPEEEILVEGVNGAVGAVVKLDGPQGNETAVISAKIEAPMAEYAFSSVSSEEDFQYNGQSWATRWEYHPVSGNAAEKIVIPEKASTELENDWHQGWLYNGSTNIKCVVFPEGLETVPYTGGINPEVISFAGNKVTKLDTYTNQYDITFGTFQGLSKLKYIRLPESLTEISSQAFAGCNALEYLYLHDGLKTIGSSAFEYHDASWNSRYHHNLIEITIPASVTDIGSLAFAYPLKRNGDTFTITYLNPNVTGAGVGYDSRGKFIKMRVADTDSGSDAYDSIGIKAAYQSKEDLNNMSIAEVAARASVKAAELGENAFDEGMVDTYKQKIIEAYGSPDSFAAEWESDIWNETDGLVENTLVISKDSKVFKLKLSLPSSNFDLVPYIEEKGIEFNNKTTSASLFEALKTIELPENFSVTGVEDFYLIKSVSGAVDKSTAYKVPSGEETILPGYKGYMSAVIGLNTPYGAQKTTLLLDIEPEMVEYKFQSTSKENEFEIDSNGVLRAYNGTAEKVVIPEGVKTIAGDAFTSKATLRAVILPESLTSLSAALAYAPELELVYMGDNVETVTARAFERCYFLKGVRLSEKIKSIPTEMFKCTYSLHEIYLPYSVETLGDGAFIRSGIKGITLSENVTSVGQYGFSWLFKNHHCIDTELSQEIKDRLDEYAASVEDETCIITVLNPDTVFDTVGNFNRNDYFTPIAVKANENSKVFSGTTFERWLPADRRILLENVSLAEAAARAKQRADIINGSEISNIGEFLNNLTVSYGSSSNVNAAFQNRVWAEKDEYRENTLIISKGASFKIPVFAKFQLLSIQNLVNEMKLECTNATTETKFLKAFSENLPVGYTVSELLEFYKVNSIGGAKDETEVLVEGHIGAAAAILKLQGPDGKESVVYSLQEIAPVIKEYSFASVSAEGEFTVTDGVLTAYSGTAEKIVIPEGVVTLGDNWISGEAAKAVKCIIYPESLEGTVPAQAGLTALQVAAFKGDKVTELGFEAFFKAVRLECIELPQGLKTISEKALATGPNGKDTKLTEIYLPEGLEVIGKNAFYWNSSDWEERARQGYFEITIPASVKTIGTGAFNYPQKTNSGRNTFTLTVLGKDTVMEGAVGKESSDGADIVIRAQKDSSAWNKHSSSNYTRENLSEMTLTEAAARGYIKADEMSKRFYDSANKEDIAKELALAYGSLDFAPDWNDTWDESIDGKRTGVITLSKGEYAVEIPVELTVTPQYSLQDLEKAVIASMDTLKFDNSVTAEGLTEAINKEMPGGYKVKISEFYLYRAIDGAKENKTVLVAGHNGSASAIVTVTDFYGNQKKILTAYKVMPVLENYTFNSVSKEEDFLLSEDGKTLIEYYGRAEKIVVPEGVERITAGWMWGNPTVTKALVLPESLKMLPRSLCEGMSALEVVSMYDNVVNTAEKVFSDCYSLKYIHLSDNIEAISADMFSYTYSLFSIRIPESVVYIGENAFIRSSVRDITIPRNVEEVQDWGVSFVPKDASTLTTQWFGLDSEIASNISEWVNSNAYENGEARPVTVTVLNPDTKFSSGNFNVGNVIYAKTVVRADKASEAYKIVENRLSTDKENPELKWAVEELDMSLTEAVARANAAVDSLVLYNGMTAESVKEYIQSIYVSSDASESVSWSREFVIKNATAKENGSATGLLQLQNASGELKINIDINSTVLEKRPEGYQGEDSGDIWGDDWDDDSLDDLEDFDDFGDFEDFEDLDDFDEFDDFGDFEDFEEFEEFDDSEIEEDVIYEDEPTPDENAGSAQNKNEESKFPWIWVIIGAGVALLLAGGAVVLIIIRKKKNNK